MRAWRYCTSCISSAGEVDNGVVTLIVGRSLFFTELNIHYHFKELAMIETLPSPAANILGFRLSGKLHDADYKTFTPAIDAAAGTSKVRLLAQFHDFQGWD